LRELEHKYSDVLVVIGVHSAKFMAEKATDAIRDAVLRYEIRHPVVNDRDFKLWNAYAVRAWPTFMFIDPRGKVIGKHEGEVPVEAFDEMLTGMIAEFDAEGTLDRRPVDFRLEELQTTSPLAFPGKVGVNLAENRLFIADTNHHRLLVTGLDGAVQTVIGSGTAGAQDGDFASVQFNAPQGFAYADGTVYIADTANHLLRVADLATGQVTTLAGTGAQGRTFYRHGGVGREMPLNSPWDVTVADGTVYITMAGYHQVWRYDLASGEIAPWAGSGREAIKDGAVRTAHFAQPYGITHQNGIFYVADSETSAIRRIDSAENSVTSPVGLGLFDFGDEDGEGENVRLQHPFGVTVGAHGEVFISDSYNNKLKRLDPVTRRVTTLAGDGTPGYQDGDALSARFNEPGGIAFADNILYIADTNNHVIRKLDLASGKVSTLQITGI
jgi:DNA-binding beta-propeller fold protein YncE